MRTVNVEYRIESGVNVRWAGGRRKSYDRASRMHTRRTAKASASAALAGAVLGVAAEG